MRRVFVVVSVLVGLVEVFFGGIILYVYFGPKTLDSRDFVSGVSALDQYLELSSEEFERCMQRHFGWNWQGMLDAIKRHCPL